MSNEKHLALTPWSALLTGEGFARVIGAGEEREFTLDDLGLISEWLATAWQNVAGEEYKPVVISERGYVADEGASIWPPAKPGEWETSERPERDCE